MGGAAVRAAAPASLRTARLDCRLELKNDLDPDSPLLLALEVAL